MTTPEARGGRSFAADPVVEAPGELPQIWAAQLVSCVVDENVGLPDTAVLTYRDPDNEFLKSTGITLGTPLKVSVVTVAGQAREQLFNGEVTAVEIDRDGTGSFTVVRAYSKAHRLQRGLAGLVVALDVRIAAQQVAVMADRVAAGALLELLAPAFLLGGGALLGGHRRRQDAPHRTVGAAHLLLAVHALGDRAIGGQALAAGVDAGIDVGLRRQRDRAQRGGQHQPDGNASRRAAHICTP